MKDLEIFVTRSLVVQTAQTGKFKARQQSLQKRSRTRSRRGDKGSREEVEGSLLWRFLVILKSR